MFDNIGGKIKKLSKIFCWIGIIADIFVGFYLIALGEGKISGINAIFIIVGWIIIILGPIISWISSFFMYGFGQLIENSDMLIKKMDMASITTNSKQGKDRKPQVEAQPKKANNAKPKVIIFNDFEYISEDKIKCRGCGTIQNSNRNVCFECGRYFAQSSEGNYVDFPCPDCGEMLSYPKENLSANQELNCPHCNTLLKARG